MTPAKGCAQRLVLLAYIVIFNVTSDAAIMSRDNARRRAWSSRSIVSSN